MKSGNSKALHQDLPICRLLFVDVARFCLNEAFSPSALPAVFIVSKHPASPRASAGLYPRPAKLYLYAQREALKQSLQLGEFTLRPAHPIAVGGQIPASGAQRAGAGFLTLSLSSAWDDKLFDTHGADCCLVIRDTEQFGERLHRAVQRMLPSWAGIDAAVSYGTASPLGAAFSKSRPQAAEKEWLFAWRPTQAALVSNPVTIGIGSIESIAELRERD